MHKHTISEKDKDYIVDRFIKQKHSPFKIAKDFDCHHMTIRNWLKRWGYKMREGNKLNKCNENYFEKIDSEDKAYFLGLMYADGNVGKGGGRSKSQTPRKMTISLQDRDVEILNKMKNCLEFEGNLLLEKSRSKNWRAQYKICLTSKKLCADLIKLGCMPRKSLILKFPTEEQVPSNLMRHFIRGYFDGDGCIYKKNPQGQHKSPDFCFSVVGTKDVCMGIKLWIEKYVFNFPVGELLSEIVKNEHFTFRVGGNNRIRKLYPFLYEESNFFLERKKEKFLESFNYIQSKSSKYNRISYSKVNRNWTVSVIINKKAVRIYGLSTEIEAYLKLCKLEEENGLRFSNDPVDYFNQIKVQSS